MKIEIIILVICLHFFNHSLSQEKHPYNISEKQNKRVDIKVVSKKIDSVYVIDIFVKNKMDKKLYSYNYDTYLTSNSITSEKDYLVNESSVHSNKAYRSFEKKCLKDVHFLSHSSYSEISIKKNEIFRYRFVQHESHLDSLEIHKEFFYKNIFGMKMNESIRIIFQKSKQRIRINLSDSFVANFKYECNKKSIQAELNAFKIDTENNRIYKYGEFDTFKGVILNDSYWIEKSHGSPKYPSR
jgi:hypothetical protein